jgi:hypothetical protein
VSTELSGKASASNGGPGGETQTESTLLAGKPLTREQAHFLSSDPRTRLFQGTLPYSGLRNLRAPGGGALPGQPQASEGQSLTQR